MLERRLPLILAILAILSFSFLPPSELGQASDDESWSPVIQAMLDQVEQSQVYSLTGGLSGEWPVMIDGQPYTITTRHALSGEPIQKSTRYLYEHYLNLGLETSLHDFYFSGKKLSNVIAQKTGTVFPERIFMITSHFDDVPINPPAPGADDDASGTVGVMLAASILSQYEFGCTLRFVNFNAEEYGMIGSEDYAHQAYCNEEDIRGVVNLDMIAWNTPQSAPEMDLHALETIPESALIASIFKNSVSTYSLGITATDADPVTSRSDHASFWEYGIPAILVSEDLDDFNPNYHSADDTLDNLQDLDYFTDMIKASIGTLAQMGCLVENGWGTIRGVVTDKSTALPVTNTSISLHNPEWGYTFKTRTDQNGTYQISALDGIHDLSVDGIGYSATFHSNLNINRDKTLTFDVALSPLDEQITFLPLTANISNLPPAGCP
jgi:hypothetical protein